MMPIPQRRFKQSVAFFGRKISPFLGQFDHINDAP